MDKLKPITGKITAAQLARTNNSVNEIVDWLTAHDEREARTREMLPMQPCGGFGKAEGGEFPKPKESLLDIVKAKVEEAQKQLQHDFEQSMEDHWKKYSDKYVADSEVAAEKATIGQELEAGLIPHRFPDGTCSCTRIYLREYEYKELAKEQLREGEGIHFRLKFHDIPVYCGGPDIHFCTD